MQNKLVLIVKKLYMELSENYSAYNEEKLKRIVSQFQLSLLDLRKKDHEIQVSLQDLSPRDLKLMVKRLDLPLLSIPSQKYKLVSVLNGLIDQEGKKNDLFKEMEGLKSTARKTTSKSSRTPSSLGNTEEIRNKWLIHKDLNSLTRELNKINMNTLRAIVRPWNVKPIGRKKDDLVNAIIAYIRKIKGLSELGT
ncbi:MAG: hypothetical protein ACFFAS_18625 [Promethearchaeota archaeon]